MRFVLASASPRRRELLEQLGLAIEVVPAHVDESPVEYESPDAYVRRLSRDKAESVASTLLGEDDQTLDWAVIAADTCVSLDGEIFGKPTDDADAARILHALSRRPHEVITAVTVMTEGAAVTDTDRTTVTMTPMSDDDIDWYIATGEPFGKAGAFAIQGVGGAFIERIDGSVSNVVGLPLVLTRTLLSSVGVDVLTWSRARPARR